MKYPLLFENCETSFKVGMEGWIITLESDEFRKTHLTFLPLLDLGSIIPSYDCFKLFLSHPRALYSCSQNSLVVPLILWDLMTSDVAQILGAKDLEAGGTPSAHNFQNCIKYPFSPNWAAFVHVKVPPECMIPHFWIRLASLLESFISSAGLLSHSD